MNEPRFKAGDTVREDLLITNVGENSYGVKHKYGRKSYSNMYIIDRDYELVIDEPKFPIGTKVRCKHCGRCGEVIAYRQDVIYAVRVEGEDFDYEEDEIELAPPEPVYKRGDNVRRKTDGMHGIVLHVNSEGRYEVSWDCHKTNGRVKGDELELIEEVSDDE